MFEITAPLVSTIYEETIWELVKDSLNVLEDDPDGDVEYAAFLLDQAGVITLSAEENRRMAKYYI